MDTLYSKERVIKNPRVLSVPNVKRGDKITVHILPPEQLKINLSFSRNPDPDHPDTYVTEATTEYQEEFQRSKKLQKALTAVEKRIIELNGVYTSYSYLFIWKGQQLHLLSVGVNTFALGFDAAKEIAEQLSLGYAKPNWQGTYNSTVLAAFIEDIFVQNK